MFTPTRAAALAALEDFLPRAGRDYAERRNTDTGLGLDAPAHVSRLSPWLRTRSIAEWEVIDAVLGQHGRSAAEKFIDEVCWRTYWKGWLELRPRVWLNYLEAVRRDRDHTGKSKAYHQAIAGTTGIDCFDAWVAELTGTGYLHNHARMWFASIWIHTLRLPWSLGADFFLRYLLDGDAASNTLSWRWVAGLHTRDKAYLATAQNIRKFTAGRFKVTANLASHPAPLVFEEHPAARPLPPTAPEPLSENTVLLLTEDDLGAARWLGQRHRFKSIVALLPQSAYDALGIDQSVADFRRAAIADSQPDACFSSVAEFIDWTQARAFDAVLMAAPAAGIWDEPFAELSRLLDLAGVRLVRDRHWWDRHFYPSATHGFFRFKKAIPDALARLR